MTFLKENGYYFSYSVFYRSTINLTISIVLLFFVYNVFFFFLFRIAFVYFVSSFSSSTDMFLISGTLELNKINSLCPFHFINNLNFFSMLRYRTISWFQHDLQNIHKKNTSRNDYSIKTKPFRI